MSKSSRRVIIGELEKELREGARWLRGKASERHSNRLVLRAVAPHLLGYIASHEFIPRTIRMAETVLVAAEEFDGDNLVTLQEKHFSDYLRDNVWYWRCERHAELDARTKNSFGLEVAFMSPMVKAKGDTYKDLLQDAYPTVSRGREAVETHIAAKYGSFQLIRERRWLRTPSSLRLGMGVLGLDAEREVYWLLDQSANYAMVKAEDRLFDAYGVRVKLRLPGAQN